MAKFVFTGTLGFTRWIAERTAIDNDHQIQLSVNSNTDFLVVGDKPGSNKMNKAVRYGTKQITEKQFLKIITKKEPLTQVVE